MVTRPKAVFNWSGGKDSALALLETLRAGTCEVVALLTTVNRDTRRSTMHAIPEALLRAQADSTVLPPHVVDPAPAGEVPGFAAAQRQDAASSRA